MQQDEEFSSKEEKQQQSQKIADDTEAFLKSGGKVESLPPVDHEGIKQIKDKFKHLLRTIKGK